MKTLGPAGDRDLAELQAALLALLVREDLTTEERIATIRREAAFAPFADYFATMRPVDVEFLAKVVAYRARPRLARSAAPESRAAPSRRLKARPP